MENERLLSDMDLVELFCMDCDLSLDCRENGNPCEGMEFAEVAVKAQDAKTTAALIAWLDEPCEIHRGIHGWFELHRYLCPQCWQELKESTK
jgi:hypothetical protein